MRYRIYDVLSWWCGLRYHVEFKHGWWPFWQTGPAFQTEEEARSWVEWDKRNKHAGMEVVMEDLYAAD